MISVSGLGQILSSTKTALDLVKSLLIVGIVLLVIIEPTLVSEWMTASKLDEVDLPGGVKIKKALRQTTDAAFDLKATVAELSNRLMASQKLLEQALVKSDLNSVRAAIDDNRKAINSAQTSEAGATKTLQNNSAAIADVQQGLAGTWAVIFGTDTSPSAAEPEVTRAKNHGFADSAIFQKQNWYRSAALFGSRDEALNALPAIKALSVNSGGAYVVNLPTWCPNKSSVRPGLFVCP